MFYGSYAEFDGIDCTLLVEDNYLTLIPKATTPYTKMLSYAAKKNFLFIFTAHGRRKFTAYIEEVEVFDNAFRLHPIFITQILVNKPIHSIEITGTAIDDFFSPVFYFLSKQQKMPTSDMLYSTEVADQWDIRLKDTPLTVTLNYGSILSRGTASDLMLHPRLKVHFPPTEDQLFVYQVYQFITRFLCFVRYMPYYGETQIDLIGSDDDHDCLLGYLVDKKAVKTHSRATSSAEYSKMKPYIARLLQFAASNPDLPTASYPESGLRIQPKDYPEATFHAIYAAFENECKKQPKLYECADDSKIRAIRQQIVEQIKNVSSGETDAEKQFLNDAINRIQQLGTQFGQTRRIINAYSRLQSSLTHSLHNLLWRIHPSETELLSESEIKDIAKRLTDLRGKVSHGSHIEMLSEEETQMVRFLEAMTYIQMLTRAGLSPTEAEMVCGAVMFCNSLLLDQAITIRRTTSTGGETN